MSHILVPEAALATLFGSAAEIREVQQAVPAHAQNALKTAHAALTK